MKYYDYSKGRLIFEGSKATSHFWDSLWNTPDLKKTIEGGGTEQFVSRITKKFIQPSLSKKILEGGCGKGVFVFSLTNSGYDAYGIDFALETIKRVNEVMPRLNIKEGDVRKLDFPNDFFDGYWSLGVIEHFFEGYENITQEMRRVIKKEGFLFLTFPYLSPLRRLKAFLKIYPDFDEAHFNKEKFYQFGLDPKKVENNLKKLGFSLVYTERLDGFKGLKDEVGFLKKPLQKIYDHQSFIAKALGFFISKLCTPFCAHSILLVFKKH